MKPASGPIPAPTNQNNRLATRRWPELRIGLDEPLNMVTGLKIMEKTEHSPPGNRRTQISNRPSSLEDARE